MKEHHEEPPILLQGTKWRTLTSKLSRLLSKNTISCRTRKSDNLSHWMRDLPAELTNVPLSLLAIPGSHDSGANDSLSTKFPIANDMDGHPMKKIKLIDIRPYVKRWAVTQHKTALDQLKIGVRYFDLRISKTPSKFASIMGKELRIVHGLYGQKLAVFLKDIYGFLKTHIEEVVILDVNHVYTAKKLEETTYKEILDLVNNIFGEMIQQRSNLRNLTLESMRKERKQVILICAKDISDKVFVASEAITSPYYETNDPRRMLATLNFVERARSLSPGKLFVSQGVLTPKRDDYLKHLSSSLEERLSGKASVTALKWLCNFKSPQLINVVILDFITDKNSEDIIAINKKKMERFHTAEGLKLSVLKQNT